MPKNFRFRVIILWFYKLDSVILLLDFGFSKVNRTEMDVNLPRNINVVGGEDVFLCAVPEDNIYFCGADISSDCKIDVLLNDFVYAPVNKGDTIGKVICYIKGKRV